MLSLIVQLMVYLNLILHGLEHLIMELTSYLNHLKIILLQLLIHQLLELLVD